MDHHWKILTGFLFFFSTILLGSSLHTPRDISAHILPLVQENNTPTNEMSTLKENSTTGLSLQVPLENSIHERSEMMRKIIKRSQEVNHDNNYRDIYEDYIDHVGANGLIESVHTIFPSCHSEGHDMGKVVYSKIGNIGDAMRTCDDACYSGCMHGVLMEAFTTPDPGEHEHDEGVKENHRHIELPDIKEKINTLCTSEDISSLYKEGDCLHGVGHALMYLSDYNVPKAIEYCDLFPEGPKAYYCATGAYMEYVSVMDEKDATTQSVHYPCDEGKYPAACFRYKMVHVVIRHYLANRKYGKLVNDCLALEPHYRRACFHGLGNAHNGYIVLNRVNFDDVCAFGDKNDQYMCLEGAIERMAKYHPNEAKQACNQLSGWKNELCILGLERKMYNLEKPFELYLK